MKYKFNELVIGNEGLLKGPFGSDLKRSLYVPKSKDTYKVYLQENILKQDNSVGTHYISKEYYNKAMYRYAVKENDFVVTCDGTLGEIFQLKNLTEKGIISSSLLRITLNPKLIDYDFFYYFFKEKMKKALITSANNSVLKHLPGLSFIRDFEIDIPDLPTQKKIADVLSCIDEKIALNNKTNTELENMAKTIYDYWFTQFDFPNKNGHPYKTSGDQMVYNETLKRDIPAGWEVGKLSDIAEIFNGSTPSTKEDDNYGGNIVWITPKDLSDQQRKFTWYGERNITEKGYKDCNTTLVPKGTILLSSRAPIGLVSIAACKLCTNQGFKNIVPRNPVFSNYIYYVIKTNIPKIEQLGSGTTFKEVSKQSMETFKVIIPPLDIIEKYNIKVCSIFDEQLKLLKENDELTKLRDYLLPLLMNGQIEVK